MIDTDVDKDCFKCKHFMCKLWFLNGADGELSMGYCLPKSDSYGYFHITKNSQPCELWEKKNG